MTESLDVRRRTPLTVALCALGMSFAGGCSGTDETRVDAVIQPGADAPSEGRLEPDPAEAPDDSASSSSSVVGGSAETGMEGPTGGFPRVSGGSVTDNASRPWIDDLSDRRVLRGEGVLLSGGRLLPNPNVLLGNSVILPVDASLSALKFIVPEDLVLTRCEVTFRLVVKTDLGLSPSTEIAVLQDPPEIAVSPSSVQRGAQLWPRVEPEGEGTIEVESPGRAPVRLELSLDGAVTIPSGTPEGPAILRWTTRCGEAVTVIDVQPPGESL